MVKYGLSDLSHTCSFSAVLVVKFPQRCMETITLNDDKTKDALRIRLKDLLRLYKAFCALQSLSWNFLELMDQSCYKTA